MKYFSTRGGDERLSFEETVMTGLAPNGGLYVPEVIPALPDDWASRWPGLSFEDLALEIYSLFVSPSEVPRADLARLIRSSYSAFRDPSVAPLKRTDEREWVLELWHGPTFAFKDVALQFLGNLFEYFLQRRNAGIAPGDPNRERLTVVGATSGDTGSAAIYGLRGKQDVSIFILHPYGRVSPVQEAQMTTVADANVFNLAVDGTFDDCQDIVKILFSDKKFNKRYRLGAINSINWARILAQIVYYFSSYFALRKQLGLLPGSQAQGGDVKVQYVVPTGNFGDILAGWYAKRLGLPVGLEAQDGVGGAPGLVIATNSNDILARFFRSGSYEKADPAASAGLSGSGQIASVGGSTDGSQGASAASSPSGGVVETLSPAMDILVSSNFERLLFYLAHSAIPQASSVPAAQAQVAGWMSSLKASGAFTVPPSVLTAARQDFSADRVSDAETSDTIRRYFQGADRPGRERYVVDPHTAVGLCVANRIAKLNPVSVHQIVLSTAHPAKFSSAVTSSLFSPEGPTPSPSGQSGVGSDFDFDRDVLPPEFRGLLEKPRRVIRVRGIDPDLTKAVVAEEVEKLFGVPRPPASGAEEPTASV